MKVAGISEIDAAEAFAIVGAQTVWLKVVKAITAKKVMVHICNGVLTIYKMVKI